jgi:hypothetical protein
VEALLARESSIRSVPANIEKIRLYLWTFKRHLLPAW